MKVVARFGLWALAATAAAAAALPAFAGELFVMPFSCTLADGRPHLAASSQQGHRILSRREERAFTTCSPANPALCRTLRLHKFDMECGGVDVPFIAVAAASGPVTGARAILEGGRLRIAMPQGWNLAPDDPCARGPETGEGRLRPGRLSRYCADRAALEPAAFVALPPGFSPMLDLDGVFVADPTPAAGPAPPPVALPKVAAIALPKRKPQEAAAPRPPSPFPSVPQPPSLSPAPAPAPSPTPVSGSDQATPAGMPHPAPQPAGSAPPVAPLSPSLASPAAPAGSVPDPAPAALEVLPAPKAAPPPPALPPLQPAVVRDEAKPTTARDDEMSATRPVRHDGGKSAMTSSLVLAAGGLAAFAALVAGFLALRRNQGAGGGPMSAAAVSNAAPAGRDFASASLSPGGLDLSPSPAATAPAVVPGPLVAVPRLSVETPASGPVLGLDVPRSRQEALEVLGMGVALDASETAMKKIVDGLRMSWHPDQAATQEDRLLREQRMRQINAAWDILSARHPAGGPVASLAP